MQVVVVVVVHCIFNWRILFCNIVLDCAIQQHVSAINLHESLCLEYPPPHLTPLGCHRVTELSLLFQVVISKILSCNNCRLIKKTLQISVKTERQLWNLMTN